MKASTHPRRSKWLVSLFSLGVLAAILISLTTPSIALAEHQNPISLLDSYIIVFKSSVDPQVAVPSIAQAHGLQTGFIYEHALKGMSAVVPPGRLTALLRDPRVAYIVEDMERRISAQTVPTGIQRIFADDNSEISINSVDDWRVDVDVAVIDTGIDLQHPDLNVINSTSCLNSSGGGPPWSRTYYCGAGGDDDHYHGTHVAGTIAALDNDFGVVGVAPGARLWAVKVCDAQGSCPSSAIIAGIDYVASYAAEIDVANMSLGGSGYSQAEYEAIQGAVNKGVAFAVAAGNDGDDASNYSPAAFDNVLTVSALADFDGEPGGIGSPTCFTDQDDTLAYFSNWGSAVDITAPGACILSTFPIEKGEYDTISGTSMASPHAAGALALLASRNKPLNSTGVYSLYSEVINAGNNNWIDDSRDDIKEPLLDVSNTSIFDPVLIPGSGGGGNIAPTVSITSPADGASFVSGTSISFAGSASDTEDGDLTGQLVWTSNLDGQIGMGGAFNSVLSDGSHTITATVTDSGGLTGSKSIMVRVESAGGSQAITVASLVGSTTIVNKNFWNATVSISVDPAVPEAVVSGSWSTGGTVTCITATNGTCAVTSNNLRSSIASTTFTVLNVGLAGYEYIPNVTEVMINKP